MSEATLRSPGNGRGMLLLIAGLLMLPFAIGGGLYVSGWQPAQTATHGQLLNPPQALSDELLQATGKMRGKWLLVLNVSGPCKAACEARIDELRRIQVALYKNMDRVRRVVLTDQPDDPGLSALSRGQPDLLVVNAPSTTQSETNAPLLLADPQGLVIMTFPADASAQGIRADLERLLKFTWNG